MRRLSQGAIAEITIKVSTSRGSIDAAALVRDRAQVEEVLKALIECGYAIVPNEKIAAMRILLLNLDGAEGD